MHIEIYEFPELIVVEAEKQSLGLLISISVWVKSDSFTKKRPRVPECGTNAEWILYGIAANALTRNQNNSLRFMVRHSLVLFSKSSVLRAFQTPVLLLQIQIHATFFSGMCPSASLQVAPFFLTRFLAGS